MKERKWREDEERIFSFYELCNDFNKFVEIIIDDEFINLKKKN